jgi:hypothetical protein
VIKKVKARKHAREAAGVKDVGDEINRLHAELRKDVAAKLPQSLSGVPAQQVVNGFESIDSNLGRAVIEINEQRGGLGLVIAAEHATYGLAKKFGAEGQAPAGLLSAMDDLHREIKIVANGMATGDFRGSEAVHRIGRLIEDKRKLIHEYFPQSLFDVRASTVITHFDGIGGSIQDALDFERYGETDHIKKEIKRLEDALRETKKFEKLIK